MITALTILTLWNALAHPNDGPDADVRFRIERSRVVAQITLNLVYLDEVLPLSREDPEDVTPGEESQIRAALSQYLKDKLLLRLDGVQVTSQVTGFEIPEPNHDLLPLFVRFGMRALFKVQIELTFPAKAPPSSVELTWPSFPPDHALAFGGVVPPMTISPTIRAEGREIVVILTEEEPTYTWHRVGDDVERRFVPLPAIAERPLPPPLRIPVVTVSVLLLLTVGGIWLMIQRWPGTSRRTYARWLSVGLVLAACAYPFFKVSLGREGPALTASDAEAIFSPLHRNIYAAFDYTDREDIYSALERSVAGSLLNKLYLDVYRGLVMEEEGGAVSRVESVNLKDRRVLDVGVLPDGTEGFQIHATWEVEGIVRHSQHRHRRVREYQARYAVARTPVGWRIVGNEPESDRTLLAEELDGLGLPASEVDGGR